MEIFVLAALLGIIPAMIAKKKGKNGFCWWLYGSLLFIIALPHALLMEPEGMKKCPSCAEMIRKEAKVCRFCGATTVSQNIQSGPVSSAVPAEDSTTRAHTIYSAILFFVGILLPSLGFGGWSVLFLFAGGLWFVTVRIKAWKRQSATNFSNHS